MGKKRAKPMRAKPVRPASRRRVSTAATGKSSASLLVRTSDFSFPLEEAAVLQELPREAMRWRYIVEHRKRWSNLEKSADEIAEEADKTLRRFGLGDAEFAKLAQATVVEVSIPFQSEEESWPARLLPWEFLISAVTKRMRGSADFLVVRHLNFGATEKCRTPSKAAFIEAAPGKLAEEFDFEPEYRLVRASLEDGGIPLTRIRNPIAEELHKELKAISPDVIHLSGIDIRMARQLLADAMQESQRQRSDRSPSSREQSREPKRDDQALDGIVLHDLSSKPFAEVTADELGPILAAGKPPPAFVGFNTWYSASRVAPLALAAGVQAAISFSTDFSDSLAEMLFANFYRYWRIARWDLLSSFLEAWKSLSAHSQKLKGTGVVFWSRSSLVSPPTTQASTQPRAGRQPKDRAQARKLLRDTAESDRTTDLATDDSLRDIVSVSVKPLKRINYSLLHNNGNLFDEFILRKTKPGRVRGVELEVRLHVGQDSFPFRRTFDLIQESTPLHDQIRLPLTSSLIRRVDENLATTVYARVACGGRTLYENTHRAVLLPVDQWTDTDENRQWLPSFVLPRDPAVRRLLSSAQRYLMCLADDSGAGYDGYQQVDPEDSTTLAVVDLQVQSMWTALLYEHPLAYVNPPPSYEWTSQRLRTPSQVFGEGRGTCIDLALLLAACCEFVDIYPVLFLANGHAYPGYWRSEQAYADFLSVQGIDGEAEPRDFTESRSEAKLPWIADASTYRELLNHVTAGNLVPIESTLIAGKASFNTAIAEGGKNLRHKADFHSLIDIRLARDCGITPLPLGDLS